MIRLLLSCKPTVSSLVKLKNFPKCFKFRYTMQGFAAESFGSGGKKIKKLFDLHSESCATIQSFADRSGLDSKEGFSDFELHH